MSSSPASAPSGSDEPRPEDELRFIVQKLARRIRAERSDETLSDTQLGVLFHLTVHGPSTPSRLAERDHVSPPSMNRTLNGLESAGLVARSPSVDDARRVDVTLTEAGHAVAIATRRLRTEWFDHQLATLEPHERAALDAAASVLRKLADS